MDQKEMKDPVSYFKSFHDNSPIAIPMSQVYQLITSDLFKEATEKVRYYLSAGLTDEALKEKKKLSCIVCSAICKGGRRKANAESYTGIAMVDADDVDPLKLPALLRLLAADPYVLLAHMTVSGNGLRIFYRTDVTDMGSHLQAFRQGNAYFAGLLGIPTDDKCKDLTRAGLLNYAPDAIFNPNAAILHIDPTQADKKKKAHTAHRPGTYHAEAGEAVRPIAEELHRQGFAYEKGRRNEFLSRIAYRMNRYGADADRLEDFLRTEYSDFPEAELSGIIRSVYTHTEEHGVEKFSGSSSKRAPAATILEIETFLNSQASFRHNKISAKCEVRFRDTPQEDFRPLTDRDVNTLWSRINKSGLFTRKDDLHTILHSEFVPLFDPFSDYLDHLPAWDGVTDHIARLAATVHVKSDPDTFIRYFRKWLVAILPTLIEKNIVNHEILVFIGRQGVYKTTWFNRLLPPPLQAYFYTKINSSHFTKDDQLTLSEFALVCYEEIDDMRPSELNQLKALITTQHINERAAYAHFKESRPHTASFCGTGNNIQFLSDPTGNRRWLPFEVEAIDNPYDHPVNYEGVYSQALALWKSGFQYWFDLEEIRELNRHNAHFEVPNLERELIQTHYRIPLPGEVCTFITVAKILERINAGIRQPLSPVKTGLALKELGFDRVRTNNLRGYRVVERTNDEIRLSGQSIARDTEITKSLQVATNESKDPELTF